ncbi:putative manganese catalase [Oceanobacillus picturae]|uniref:Manganese catalase n=1 Tax=Oceanobacillus picturae TaxID=171693 RepID=W9AAC3_9BACI|nr:manganese catalase family protein [Oceanobacillus picturae]RIU96568.1 manganese catalase family protein [Oceanobacillus picturae]CDO02448.1 putative manganese catalase [Oceanobacillus picturae]
MFYHVKDLQYHAKPDRPDPVFAKKLQEVLGGQYGEISVMMQYLFQGWNVRGNGKYKDLLMDIGTEEIAHVEMLATLIARLLDNAPDLELDDAVDDPVVAAILGGSNPQHAIVSGLGAMPVDSVGNRWTASYIGASGNLIADFRANLMAESMGRLQVARLYEMTNDSGVRNTLSWLIARDTAHQNQWYAAIKELEEKENIVVPSTFPRELEVQQVAYTLFNFSQGDASAEGRWAHGPSMDGCGTFNYVDRPVAFAPAPHLPPAPPYIFNTPAWAMRKSDDLPDPDTK